MNEAGEQGQIDALALEKAEGGVSVREGDVSVEEAAHTTAESPVATAEVPPVSTVVIPPVPATGIPPLPMADVPPAPAGESSPAPRRRGRKRLFILIGGVMGVALIASLAAIALSGGGAPAAKKSSGPPVSPAPALPLLAPTGLSAKAEPFSVTLTWIQPATGAKVNVYKVYRDGVLVGTVAAPSSTFTDSSNIVPGKAYDYEVTSRGETLEESARTSVTVETPVPPLSAARVAGDFNVVVKVVSKSGFSSYPKRFTLAWSFDPKCDDGACQVAWKDLQTSSFKTTFKRKGASYSGSDSGDFGSTCGKISHNSSLTIRFKVTKARAIEGDWRASKLTGTITQYDAPQLGCVTGRASMAFTATVLS